MKPEHAAAQICAALESQTGRPIADDGRAAVLAWCSGTTPSGESRAGLIGTDEGETLLRMMLRRVRQEGESVSAIARLRGGTWDAKGIQSLVLALDSGTRLCNGR